MFSSNTTVTAERPKRDTLRTSVSPGSPLMADSTGKVMRRSTSTGPSDGASGRPHRLAFVVRRHLRDRLERLDDQFAQAFDRIVQSAPAAVIELWPAFAVATLVSLSLIVFSVPASGRASPASLQRFLF